jgi:hypothetical protein
MEVHVNNVNRVPLFLMENLLGEVKIWRKGKQSLFAKSAAMSLQNGWGNVLAAVFGIK